MQNKYFVLCCSTLTLLALNTANAVVKDVSGNAPPNKEKVTTALANITVPFAENRGQADAKVAFQAKTLAGLLFVTKTGENATD